MDFGASRVASALARAGLPDGVGRVGGYEDAEDSWGRGASARGGAWYVDDGDGALGGELSEGSSTCESEDELAFGGANSSALAAFDRADTARGVRPRGAPARGVRPRGAPARGALAARGLRDDSWGPDDGDELLVFSELLKDAATRIAQLAGRAAPRTVYVGAYTPPESVGDDPRDEFERGGGWQEEYPEGEYPEGVVSLGTFITGGLGPASDESDDAGASGASGDEVDEVDEVDGDESQEDGYMADGGGEDSRAYEPWEVRPRGPGGPAAPGAGWSILDYATQRAV